MGLWSKLTLAYKLTLAFIGIGILTILTVSIVSYQVSRTTLERNAFQKLVSIRETKAVQIESYFEQIRNQIVTFSEDRMIIDAMLSFRTAFKNLENQQEEINQAVLSMDKDLEDYYKNEFLTRLEKNTKQKQRVKSFWPEKAVTRWLQYHYIAANPSEVGNKHELSAATDGSEYSSVHRLYHPIIANYLERFGYYDIFLVDADTGHIVYSVFKEVDYATSLLTGPYKNTNFSRAFREAKKMNKKDFVKLVDFESYEPSYHAQASFIASPIFEGEDLIGILIFQMPVDRINTIMTNGETWREVGLGESGETYLVASDYTLRNQSRFLIEDREAYLKAIPQYGLSMEKVDLIKSTNSSIGLQEVRTAGVQKALDGLSGEEVFDDYRGVPVLSAFKPLHIQDVNWVIMSEIDQEEAYASINSLRNQIFIWSVGILALVGLLGFSFSKLLSNPIRNVASMLEDIASGEGDLTRRLEKKADDEIGQVSYWFNRFIEQILNIVRDVRGDNEQVTTVSEGLTSHSAIMRDKAARSTEVANTVASAAEEMNVNMTSVTQSIEELLSRISDVAGTVKELANSINEIAGNTEKALSTTNGTVTKIKTAAEDLDQLGDAAQSIGEVTELISSFSDKTDLLALNATIEAARAGAAGRGFAVVANDIKELSKQTAEATGQINSRINNIQAVTNRSIAEINAVLLAISEVADNINSIASAVEQQSVATKEIADVSDTVALAANDIGLAVKETSGASSQVASEISAVYSDAKDISAFSDQLDAQMSELNKLNDHIMSLMKRFKIE